LEDEPFGAFEPFFLNEREWEGTQGNPQNLKDNGFLVANGITKWDNNPTDVIIKLGAQQPAPDAPNLREDRVIYYVDKNNNGQWDPGESIVHSAIVVQVDKEGNTTLVIGKMGEAGVSINHPDAPGYYHDDGSNSHLPTKRAYFRVPQWSQRNTSADGAKDFGTNSGGRGISWDQAISMLYDWMETNKNIQVNVIIN